MKTKARKFGRATGQSFGCECTWSSERSYDQNLEKINYN